MDDERKKSRSRRCFLKASASVMGGRAGCHAESVRRFLAGFTPG